MITKKELLQMLTNSESYNIERTESTANTDKFCQAICAFSNDISGSAKNGYLIIGAKDNGELSGLQVDDKLLLQIANIRTDGNILPQPIMTVEKFSFDQGDVLVVRTALVEDSARFAHAVTGRDAVEFHGVSVVEKGRMVLHLG